MSQLDFDGNAAGTPPLAVLWEQRCPYCLMRHGRPRAVYCSPEHARRAGNERARSRYGIRRAQAIIMARVKARATNAHRWRNITAGRDPEANLRALFGTLPAPDTHVAEWDGDPS